MRDAADDPFGKESVVHATLRHVWRLLIRIPGIAPQGVLASRVLELLWGMIKASDADADVVAAAIKGLRGALHTYDASLGDSQVWNPELTP